MGTFSRTTVGLAGSVLLLAGGYLAFAAPMDQIADLVLGQADFALDGENRVDGKGLDGPTGVAIDSLTDPLFVADPANNRVLGWASGSSFLDGEAADLVIGQGNDFLENQCNNGGLSLSSLCTPVAVAVGGPSTLWVADQGNDRVLGYTNPFTDDIVADVVINGLTDVTGVSASDVANPWVYVTLPGQVIGFFDPVNEGTVADVQIDCPAGDVCAFSGVVDDPTTGDVYVADAANNRVLAYEDPTNDTDVDFVIGQPDLMTTGCNSPGGSPSATSLCLEVVGLQGLAFSGGLLIVPDSGNDRVLAYMDPLAGIDALAESTADFVLGQTDFTTTDGNIATCVVAIDDGTFCGPTSVTVDTDGGDDLYIADFGNNRVLRYDGIAGPGATVGVLGQPDFEQFNRNFTDAGGLLFPTYVAIDRSVTPNRVYVSDSDNHRILVWLDEAALVNGQPANAVIGQPDFVSGLCNRDGGATPAANTLCNPRGLFVDVLGNLHVADTGNNRVLVYLAPLVSPSADIVLGQTDFVSGDCNLGAGSPTAATLCAPTDVAEDPTTQDLVVADTGNHRVVVYASGYASGDPSALQIGQALATTGACNSGGISSSSLCSPLGVAVDGAGTFYVSDSDNNRVLAYLSPTTTDEVADLVLGQVDFTSQLCNRGGGPIAESLCEPFGLDLDASGNLYVADQDNSRVLQYLAPLANGQLAARVFGKPNFNTAGPCLEPPDASSLCAAQGVAVDDDGDLFVVDTGNDRVLRYDQPATAVPPPVVTVTPGGPTPTMPLPAETPGPTPTPPPVTSPGDDTTATVAVYDPATGLFTISNSNAGGAPTATFQYGPGGPGLIPLGGDWNGDGIETIGLYIPSTGFFALRDANSAGVADHFFQFGPPGNFLPIAGDWDGDGIETVGFYDPATGIFALRNINAPGIADFFFQYGPPGGGLLPLAGDWNADGIDTIGLYSPATGLWALRDSNTPGFADHFFQYGPEMSPYLPVTGDFDGDRFDTIGIYDRETGTFALRNSNSAGFADLVFTLGPPNMTFVPIVNDWDGL